MARQLSLEESIEQFNKIFDSLPANGWLTKAEAILLWECVQKTKGPILEVGCYYGRSTALLAESGRWVHTVDPFENFDTGDMSGEIIHKAFIDNMMNRDLKNIIVYKQKIEDWIPWTEFSLAYLDGDHTYKGTVAQIRKAQMCKPKIIAIHDVNDDGGGAEVKRAALELLGPWVKRTGRMAVWELS